MSIKNKLDLFAEPILFTFRKQTLYRTIFGGCASLIIIIFGILLNIKVFYQNQILEIIK